MPRPKRPVHMQKPLELPGPGGATPPEARTWRLRWTDRDGTAGQSTVLFTKARAEGMARELNAGLMAAHKLDGRVYSAAEDAPC
jgi:hypothetical protein